jgi:tripartite-type tricarboxylate transporter receptor subunit TctC
MNSSDSAWSIKALGLCFSLVGASAMFQPFPSKPLRLIIPYSASSATDVLGRGLASEMSDLLGQPVVVENRTGAAGRIGAGAVAKAVPDGYTLLLGTQAANDEPRAFMKSPPYNPEKDFAPISFMGVVPQVLIVNNDVPAKTLSEVIGYGRANPGTRTYAWTSAVTRISA